MGFCGLNYATHFYVEGKDNGRNFDLTYSGPDGFQFQGDDGHAAGLLLGMSFYATFNLGFQKYGYTGWEKKWWGGYPKFGWKDDGEFNLEFKLDILQLLFEIANGKAKKEERQRRGYQGEKERQENCPR